MNISQKTELESLVLNPDDGRTYPMGRMSAVSKADREETNSTLSVSEWWLEPNTEDPHIHKHPETHLFYVIEGKLMLYLQGKNSFETEKGSYIISGWTECLCLAHIRQQLNTKIILSFEDEWLSFNSCN